MKSQFQKEFSVLLRNSVMSRKDVNGGDGRKGVNVNLKHGGFTVLRGKGVHERRVGRPGRKMSSQGGRLGRR